MRLITLLLLILLLGLQLKLWTGKGGQRELKALRAQVVAQEAENAELRARNDMLKAEVEGLRAVEDAMEERARGELGMIRDGEVFYRIVEDPPSDVPDTRRPATQP